MLTPVKAMNGFGALTAASGQPEKFHTYPGLVSGSGFPRKRQYSGFCITGLGARQRSAAQNYGVLLLSCTGRGGGLSARTDMPGRRASHKD